jgi:plastocyanin
MGQPGKIAFPVILVLGAITGYVTYTSFTAAIPQENRIDSPYYQPLSPASGGNEPDNSGGAAQQQGGGAAQTGETTGAAMSNATTTTTTGAAMSNATTTGITGGNTTGTNATSAGGGTSVSIVSGASSLTNTAYNPNPVQVKVGSKVTWTNNDSQPHTVTSGSNGQPDNKFNSSPNFNPLMNQGQTFSFTFTQAGDYPYYCLLHPNMVGTVNVSS